jgi:predicted ATPase
LQKRSGVYTKESLSVAYLLRKGGLGKMIRRVKINGYKSFNNLDLELKPLSIIFGPNASGKSNLLDALHFLSQAVTQKNLKSAFDDHRGLPLESFYRGNNGASRKGDLQFTIEVDVELSDTVIKQVESLIEIKRKGIDSTKTLKKSITEKYLRYRLTVEILSDTGYLRVKDERLSAIKINGDEKSYRKPFLEQQDNSIHLRMEGQSHPFYYDLGLDHTIISTALYEPHYPHIVAFRMELSNWYTYYLEPRILMREEVPLAEVESLGPRGENLAAFLNTLKHNYVSDFENFDLHLKRILPINASIDIEHYKEGLIGLKIREDDLWLSARQISEGTLRVIGLLSAIHPRNPATMVAFEEPENGVHPARIKIISDILKNASNIYEKQIIITTHSPILPEYFDDENLFVCSKEKHQTSIKPFSTLGPLYRQKDIDHNLEDRIIRGDFGG